MPRQDTEQQRQAQEAAVRASSLVSRAVTTFKGVAGAACSAAAVTPVGTAATPIMQSALVH
eukprot:7690587-Alexandrium_andersonii.AAC.1